MNTYNWRSTYDVSEYDARLPFWQEVYEEYFGTKDIELEFLSYNKYPKMQAQGVDRKIEFLDRRCVYMEEKFLEKERDTMFIEDYDSSAEDNKGWLHTINSNLCDFLVHGYKDTMTFYIIPFSDFLILFLSVIFNTHF